MDNAEWSPAERRREVFPWALEIAAGVVTGTLVALVFGVHLGRGIACLTVGAGWVFPDLANLFTSLPGVLSGDVGAGLDQPPIPAPTGWALAASIGATELSLAFAMAAVGRRGWAQWGPGRLPGMARRAEVTPMLGVRRLRRSAPVIRPALYGRDGR